MTQISATILSEEQFTKDTEELKNLATSIDLWLATQQTPQRQETLQAMFLDMNKDLYALDCVYLATKLKAYREIYELLKA